MIYAPGEPADEKTHAAYHASVIKGFRFQVIRAMGCNKWSFTLRMVRSHEHNSQPPIEGHDDIGTGLGGSDGPGGGQDHTHRKHQLGGNRTTSHQGVVTSCRPFHRRDDLQGTRAIGVELQ